MEAVADVHDVNPVEYQTAGTEALFVFTKPAYPARGVKISAIDWLLAHWKKIHIMRVEVLSGRGGVLWGLSLHSQIRGLGENFRGGFLLGGCLRQYLDEV